MPPFKPNNRTMKSKPVETGPGERQLDGSRTATFSQPKVKPGLVARPPAPARPSDSGMERAMGAHADELHRK